MKKKLIISGMTCMHCVMHVQNALKNVKGVVDAKADLNAKNAIIEFNGNVDDMQLKAAVADAGYEVTGIENM
ncbi:MAG TPA: heavy metal-associated domain-containing protein [Clostridia bacterium]|nr:heavy metal-associated domain-containing protein [Clostridia bacterium]